MKTTSGDATNTIDHQFQRKLMQSGKKLWDPVTFKQIEESQTRLEKGEITQSEYRANMAVILARRRVKERPFDPKVSSHHEFMAAATGIGEANALGLRLFADWHARIAVHIEGAMRLIRDMIEFEDKPVVRDAIVALANKIDEDVRRIENATQGFSLPLREESRSGEEVNHLTLWHRFSMTLGHLRK